MSQTLVGLIGGTGIGEDLTEGAKGKRVEVDTPFGSPSGPVLVSEVGGQRVAILARHGTGHRFNPSRLPYRANI